MSLRKIILSIIVLGSGFVGSVTIEEYKSVISAISKTIFNHTFVTYPSGLKSKVGLILGTINTNLRLAALLSDDLSGYSEFEAQSFILDLIKTLNYFNKHLITDMTARGVSHDINTYPVSSDFDINFEFPEGYFGEKGFNDDYITVFNDLRHLLKDMIVQICNKHGIELEVVLVEVLAGDFPRRSGVGVDLRKEESRTEFNLRLDEVREEMKAVELELAELIARKTILEGDLSSLRGEKYRILSNLEKLI